LNSSSPQNIETGALTQETIDTDDEKKEKETDLR